MAQGHSRSSWPVVRVPLFQGHGTEHQAYVPRLTSSPRALARIFGERSGDRCRMARWRKFRADGISIRSARHVDPLVKLYLAGINHFDPLMRDELISWLKDLVK